MFERYTEDARRAIFFSRYEAAQTGSPCIETGHLLLGILRQRRLWSRKLGIKAVEPIAEECRRLLGSHGVKLPTSVDLPLSNESKRVLAYAAEEADRLSSKEIASQHLTMGLLREGNETSEILKRHGITLEKLRGLRSPESTSLTGRSGEFSPVPVEFVCDNKQVEKAYATFPMPWPRVGETIILGEEDSPRAYTVVDIKHFYAVPEGLPPNETTRPRKIVVTLRASKPS